MNFYQWCTLIAVIAFVVFVVFAVRTLWMVGKTAEAVDELAQSVTDKVNKTEQVFDMVDKTATLLNSRVFQAIGAGIALVNRFRRHR